MEHATEIRNGSLLQKELAPIPKKHSYLRLEKIKTEDAVTAVTVVTVVDEQAAAAEAVVDVQAEAAEAELIP